MNESDESFADDDPIEGVDRETAEWLAELQEAKDKALRAQAELENFRKRARREMDDERRYANLPLLRDLLPVVDNVSRAIDAAEKSPDVATLLEGMRMVLKQMETVFAQHHCKPIAAIDQPFDPEKHSALMKQPSNAAPPNTVVAELQRGFQLHDRVIRPTQVVVSTEA